MKKVLVIEDQVVLREFICRLLRDFPTLQLEEACGDGQEGWKAYERIRPEFVILDVFLPGLNGVEILRRLKRDNPDVLVLGFSAFPNRRIVKDMIEGGADGLVQKSEGLDVLEKAIDMVANGQTFYSPNVAGMLKHIMLNPDQADSMSGLSGREKEILQLIAESNSNKEIADKLHISVKTAETHRNNIMRKLDIHDAVGLTRYAIENGLISGTQFE
ncbi:MAG: response regulator transcription factor [Verrucomicrobiota bacterium JB024]|nr:response regulator transcription factor [Verrucomicrobiota bacterium JB024]